MNLILLEIVVLNLNNHHDRIYLFFFYLGLVRLNELLTLEMDIDIGLPF
jgi:hypothetical protein